MASAAGLPACFLISPTALPLVGSISKRRRSQRKMTFSHFSIGSRPLGFESQNHIAIKKTAARTVFFMASAAGLPACFLISPTALPLVGSISKRRRSQRKMTFSHFSIGSRPLGFESQNHIAIKKTAARTVFFMASAAGLEPTAPGLGNLCSILMSYADLKQERIITALFTKSIILRHLSTISDWPPRF